METKTKIMEDGTLETIVKHKADEGLKITTKRQVESIRKRFENGDLSQSDDNFVWICYTYNGLLNLNNYNLERQEITRLIYFACFINYEGYLKDNRIVITKSKMKKMSKLSKGLFYQFYNKMTALGIFIEDAEKIRIKEDLFSKGTLDKIVKRDNDFTRLYTKTVKYLYENTSSKHHNMLGIYFNLIPYIHRQSNIVCYNPESNMEDIQIMSMGDLSKLVGYRQKIGNFVKDMSNVTLENGDKILCHVSTTTDKNEYKMIINPDVVYGGNYYLILENREIIASYFE